jgi:hypothetical protein
MAVNCWVTPEGRLGLAGVTDMENSVAKVTGRLVFPEIVPEGVVMVALMVGLPAATVVARPLLLTVAIDVSEEVQMTWVVISKLVPSEYMPQAANCWVSPTGMLGLIGVTDMEDKVPAVTLRIAVHERVEVGTLLGMVKVAVMVIVPGERAVAKPLPLTVATDGLDDVQVTCVDISWLVWLVASEYAPVAVNCWVNPAGMVRLVGVTDMEDKLAEVTVSVVVPDLPPKVAVIVGVPTATAVARPVFLLTIAKDVFDESQVA